jgi:hypothetical protein
MHVYIYTHTLTHTERECIIYIYIYIHTYTHKHTHTEDASLFSLALHLDSIHMHTYMHTNPHTHTCTHRKWSKSMSSEYLARIHTQTYTQVRFKHTQSRMYSHTNMPTCLALVSASVLTLNISDLAATRSALQQKSVFQTSLQTPSVLDARRLCCNTKCNGARRLCCNTKCNGATRLCCSTKCIECSKILSVTETTNFS